MADTNARPDDISDLKTARLGRVTFRAWRRGFREADMVLGPFVDAEGASLSDAELDDFEALLAQDDDHELYAWIIETKATPDQYETPVMARIRAFMRAHVAQAVIDGAG